MRAAPTIATAEFETLIIMDISPGSVCRRRRLWRGTAFRKPGMVASSWRTRGHDPIVILILRRRFDQQVCFSNWFDDGKGGSLSVMQGGYNQFCPIAKASEIIAVRWMPLI